MAKTYTLFHYTNRYKHINDILPWYSYRNSRSPSRSEVEKAIVTLRSPSPTSSKLFVNGARSNLAYYKSSASPTNSDGFDYHRRSTSPPSKSTCRFSPSSYNPSKVTSFPRKTAVYQDTVYSVPNGVAPEIYAPVQEVLEKLGYIMYAHLKYIEVNIIFSPGIEIFHCDFLDGSGERTQY